MFDAMNACVEPRKLDPEEKTARRRQIVMVSLNRGQGVKCSFDTPKEREEFIASISDFYKGNYTTTNGDKDDPGEYSVHITPLPSGKK